MTSSSAVSTNSSADSAHRQRRIAFVGGGNMAAALVRGLLTRGWPSDHLRILELRAERRQWLTQELGVSTTDDPGQALTDADAVVLAVKPQQLQAALGNLRLAPGTLAVSIAAGIRTASLRLWLGTDPWIVRCMPNTPALVGVGAAALYTTDSTPAAARALAEALLAAVGTVCWVPDENQLDIVTALSGSGPAYFLLLAEAMQQAAAAMGLPPDTAAALARQTLVGAGQLVETDASTLTELRTSVTSKGGTTAAALQTLQAGQFERRVADAMSAAAERSRELGDTSRAKSSGG